MEKEGIPERGEWENAEEECCAEKPKERKVYYIWLVRLI